MKLRVASAVVLVLGSMALAVEGGAMALPETTKTQISRQAPGHRAKVEIGPHGPCAWFNPEGCRHRERRRNPEGCTDERMEMIDDRRAGYPYRNFLGAPTSDYVEIDRGCKRDFEQGTIYITYDEHADSRARVLCGPVRDLYLSLGETSSDLGWPKSDAAEKPHYTDVGFVNRALPATDLAAVGYDFEALAHRYEFAEGWVYWHPDYDAPRIVTARVHDFFEDHGGTPELGFPRNDTGMDSHAGDTLFQAFDRALIFENIHGDLELFADEILDAYLDGASEYRHYLSPIHDPLEAETELGLPTSDSLATPHGSVRLLHRGTIYYRDGAVLQVFPKFIDIIDGRVVHSDWIDADPYDIEIRNALQEDPYLADYRKDVVRRATSFVGLCGDEARHAIGTLSTEYCSEFVREVYIGAGMDSGLWGGGIFLWSVTYASQLRWIFQHESRFVWADDADTLTAEPGDYLSQLDEGHSALVVAASIDGRRLWKVGGNEGARDCVNFSEITYFDEAGVINGDVTGFGKLRASMF
jgi:hypothetical protein